MEEEKDERDVSKKNINDTRNVQNYDICTQSGTRKPLQYDSVYGSNHQFALALIQYQQKRHKTNYSRIEQSMLLQKNGNNWMT